MDNQNPSKGKGKGKGKKMSLSDQVATLQAKVGPEGSKKAESWADNEPDTVRLSAKILRLRQASDLGLTKAQQQCYAHLISTGSADAAEKYRKTMLAERAAKAKAKATAKA